MAMKAAGILVIALVLACAVTGAPFAAAQTGGEIVLPEKTRISLQLNDHLSTKTNVEGDRFTANVIDPVYSGDRLVIPKGSVVSGTISRVLRSGRFKGKAMMNLHFLSIRVPGRGEIPIVASLARVDADGSAGVQTEGTVEGEHNLGSDIARILTPGLTGAGIGGLTHGGKGAVIGAGVGAAVGAAIIFSTRGKDIEMRRGSTMDILLDRQLVLPVESDIRATRNR